MNEINKYNPFKLKLLLLLVILTIKVTYSQLPKNDIKEDTIHIDFQENFRYDVVVLYVNNIKVFEGLLYSNSTLGFARKKLTIPFINTDTISFKIIYYERDHLLTLEYNALWYKWSRKNDNGVYFDKQELNFDIVPGKDGRYIGIFADTKETKWDEQHKRRIHLKPNYVVSKKPFIYD